MPNTDIFKSQLESESQIIPQQPNDKLSFYKNFHSPEQKRIAWITICISSFFIFLFLYFINVYPDFTLIISCLSFILAIWGIIAYSLHRRPINMPIHQYKFNRAALQPSFVTPTSPSSIFAKEPTVNSNVQNIVAPSNIYRPYIISDRPKSSLQHSQFKLNHDRSLSQLASDALNTLGIPSVLFNKYLVNFKAFIQKSILQKLTTKIGLDDYVVQAMLSIPNYEHCSQYVLHRISTLAASSFLSGHFGDRGDRWNEREWTNELPSDNQIVLHIISVWISSLVGGIKATKNLKMSFKQHYIYIGSNPTLDNDDEPMLCSEDWSNFYILAKYKEQSPERFYAFPGRDSMYAALTLFFFFVREKNNFFLDGCDFKSSPFFMDRVYSTTRFE